MKDDSIARIRSLLRKRIAAARHDSSAFDDIAYALRAIRESGLVHGRVAVLQDLERRVKAAERNKDNPLVLGDLLQALEAFLEDELTAALTDDSGTNRPKRRKEGTMKYADVSPDSEDETEGMFTCEACGHQQAIDGEDEDETEADTLPGFNKPSDWRTFTCACGKRFEATGDHGTCPSCGRRVKVRRESRAARIFMQLTDPFLQEQHRANRLVERGLTARQLFTHLLHD